MPKKNTTAAKQRDRKVANINTNPETTASEVLKMATNAAAATEEEVPTANTTGTPTTNEVVEVDWEKVQHIFEYKKNVEGLETYFSNLCLQFEKNKANLMSQILYGQNDLYAMALDLQKSLNIDDSLTYELKLPVNEGEKGYFLRRDGQS